MHAHTHASPPRPLPPPACCAAPQVLGLSALGVRAAALTSLTDKDEAAAISRQVEEGAGAGGGGGLRLLYCTPEKIVSSKRFFAKASGWAGLEGEEGRGRAGRGGAGRGCERRPAGADVRSNRGGCCPPALSALLLPMQLTPAAFLPGPQLEKVYKAGRLDRIAIDEAHCCSQWGALLTG